jgi:hypothetical protein
MTRMFVLEGWNSLRREVLPPNAPAVQIEECRRVFYAGCIHMFCALQEIMDPASSEPTEADLAQMQLIEVELKQFGREMAILGAMQGASRPKG